MKNIVKQRLKEVEEELIRLELEVEKDKEENRKKKVSLFQKVNEITKLKIEQEALNILVDKGK